MNNTPVAIENNNQVGQEILFPITFARQFIDQEIREQISDPQWLIDKLEAYAALYERERIAMRDAQSNSQAFERDQD